MRLSTLIFSLVCLLTNHVAFAEKGTLLVVSKVENKVSFVDILSRSVIAELPTEQGPHELIVSDDGKWAVVTNYVGGNSLTVIDIAQKNVARNIDLSRYPRPHGIVFLPDQKHVVVTSEGSAHIVIVDIHSGTISQAISTNQPGSHMVALSKNGKLAYTSNMQANSLSIINIEKNALQRTLQVEQVPEAISTLGDELWVGFNKKGLVQVLDRKTGKVVASWSGFSFPYRVMFAQNNQVAIVQDFSKDNVRFFDVENKQELGRLALEASAGPQSGVISPVDNLLYLSLNKANKIVAIDVNARRLVAELPSGLAPDGIGFTSITF